MVDSLYSTYSRIMAEPLPEDEIRFFLDQILQHVENKGMLPPINPNKISHIEDTLPWYDAELICKWEKENE
tara:strand:- start:1109 stop:1321 length:213 start_codon:yes stop_codon:yes gene_type:complete